MFPQGSGAMPGGMMGGPQGAAQFGAAGMMMPQIPQMIMMPGADMGMGGMVRWRAGRE
jgi:hypothetical protein